MFKASLVFICMAGPVLSEGISPEAFDALTTGKVFEFNIPGQAVDGYEKYFPNRRVIFRDPDSQCSHGAWAYESGKFCFYYEDDPNPHCWSISEPDAAGTLMIEIERRSDGSILQNEMRESVVPLSCEGPIVGA